MKRICVTGGAGFLGSAVVKALSKTHEVVVLDDFSRGVPENLAGVPCRLVPGDVRNPKWVEMAVAGCDAVIHMAAVNGTQNFYDRPGEVLDIGVRGTLNVIDACRKHCVREFLFVSSSEVYQSPAVVPTPEEIPLTVPDPYNPRYSYGSSKIIGEMLTLHYGGFERPLIVRPHNIYGPSSGEDHIIPQFCRKVRRITDKRFPIVGDGFATRSFCYVEDFVAGLLTVLNKGKAGETYNVGNSVETSIRELALKIMWLAGVCTISTEIVSEGNAPAGETKRRCPDVSKLRGLGWEPKWELIDGLHDTLAWFDVNPVVKIK